MRNTSCIMCPWQLLLGKEVLQAAQLILKVAEWLTASSSKTVPLALAELQALIYKHSHVPPSSAWLFFFPLFISLFSFFLFFLDTHTQSFQIPKAHSIIKHKQLRRETSLPLQFRCPVKAFLCTDSLQARSATVNWRLTDILVRAHAVCPHFADKRQMGNNSWNSKNIHFPNQQH